MQTAAGGRRAAGTALLQAPPCVTVHRAQRPGSHGLPSSVVVEAAGSRGGGGGGGGRRGWTSTSSGPVLPAAPTPAPKQQLQGAALLPPPSNVVFVEGEFIEVGRVAGAFGVQGRVRVEPSTDNPKKRFGVAGRRVYARAPEATGLLAAGGAAAGMLALTTSGASVKPLPRGEEAWMVGFKEVVGRDAAEALQGWTLVIAAADRERLQDPDEFWVQELVGCRAFVLGDDGQQGGRSGSSSKYVGKVIDVVSGTGTHDTLVLQLATNKDDILNSRTRACMVPFAKALVPHVDRKAKQLVLAPPEGLLDMFSYRKMSRALSAEQKTAALAALAASVPPQLEIDVSSTTGSTGGAAGSTGAAARTAAQRRPSPAASVREQKLEEEEEEGEEEGEEEEEAGFSAGDTDGDEGDDEGALARWKRRRAAGGGLGGSGGVRGGRRRVLALLQQQRAPRAGSVADVLRAKGGDE